MKLQRYNAGQKVEVYPTTDEYSGWCKGVEVAELEKELKELKEAHGRCGQMRDNY